MPVLTSTTVIASVRSMTSEPPEGSQTLRSIALAICSSIRWAAKTSSSAVHRVTRGARSGATSSTYSLTSDHAVSPETTREAKSSVKTSRITRMVRSGSPWSSTGAPPLPDFRDAAESALERIRSHCLLNRSTSARSSSSEAPSAAVRTMTPAESGTIVLRMALSRARSVSGSLREMPVIWPSGTKTRYRPGSEICEVRRAPLWPIGSLVTWTRTVSPEDSAFSIRLDWLTSRPAASQFTSPA